MSDAKGNVVMAGDKIYAGIVEDNQSECTNALVIEFKDADELCKAIKSRRVEFTLFEINRGEQ